MSAMADWLWAKGIGRDFGTVAVAQNTDTQIFSGSGNTLAAMFAVNNGAQVWVAALVQNANNQGFLLPADGTPVIFQMPFFGTGPQQRWSAWTPAAGGAIVAYIRGFVQ